MLLINKFETLPVELLLIRKLTFSQAYFSVFEPMPLYFDFGLGTMPEDQADSAPADDGEEGSAGTVAANGPGSHGLFGRCTALLTRRRRKGKKVFAADADGTTPNGEDNVDATNSEGLAKDSATKEEPSPRSDPGKPEAANDNTANSDDDTVGMALLERMQLCCSNLATMVRQKWNQMKLYVAGVVYASVEATSAAARVGAGQCSECVRYWPVFGLAAIIAIMVPVFLVVKKRCGAAAQEKWKQMKKNYQETGSIWK